MNQVTHAVSRLVKSTTATCASGSARKRAAAKASAAFMCPEPIDAATIR